jgi:hypothetical protein
MSFYPHKITETKLPPNSEVPSTISSRVLLPPQGILDKEFSAVSGNIALHRVPPTSRE